MIYLNEWTNECTNECNEWDHWVGDIEKCEIPDQYIMIDAQIICVNNILEKYIVPHNKHNNSIPLLTNLHKIINGK